MLLPALVCGASLPEPQTKHGLRGTGEQSTQAVQRARLQETHEPFEPIFWDDVSHSVQHNDPAILISVALINAFATLRSFINRLALVFEAIELNGENFGDGQTGRLLAEGNIPYALIWEVESKQRAKWPVAGQQPPPWKTPVANRMWDGSPRQISQNMHDWLVLMLDVMEVGDQHANGGRCNYKGKLQSSSRGFAFTYRIIREVAVLFAWLCIHLSHYQGRCGRERSHWEYKAGQFGDGHFRDGHFGDGHFGDGHFGDGHFGDGHFGDGICVGGTIPDTAIFMGDLYDNLPTPIANLGHGV